MCKSSLYFEYKRKVLINNFFLLFSRLYQRNANVLVKLVDFEMASYFLSAAKHLTLLESNAILIGLFNPTNSEVKDERNDLLKAELNSFNSEPIY